MGMWAEEGGLAVPHFAEGKWVVEEGRSVDSEEGKWVVEEGRSVDSEEGKWVALHSEDLGG